MSTPDFENLSDEDFAKLENPGAPDTPEITDDSVVQEEPTTEDVTLQADNLSENESLFDAHHNSETLEDAIDAASEEKTGEDDSGSETKDKTEDDTSKDNPDPAAEGEEDSSKEEDHTKPKQTKEVEDAPKDDATAKSEDADDPATEPDPKKEDEPAAEDTGSEEGDGTLSAEDAYKKIMAPFKANGRDFTPKSPDDVIKLMQMGAGYAKKMQALRPNLKLMRMLENKDLLDESKLNFLIDLNDRNPAAIQKLLHDSKIDPLDIDTKESPEYTPNNHAVSDAQYTFQETLQDVMSAEGGQELVQTINQTWDKTSKEVVFEDPSILKLLHEQRENGIYARITDELERQKVLGHFNDVPFINAYKAVGDYLHARGELLPAPSDPVTTPNPGTAAAPKPREMVETRTAAPRTNLANDDQAASAANTRSSPSPAKKPFDPLNMTDEEIMAMSLPNS